MPRLLDLERWMVASSPEGPLWYRGLAEAPEGTLADGVTAMLARFHARYVVVGHTPQSIAQITPRFGSRVFLIDTGMLAQAYQGRATALEIRGGRFAALSADRDAIELPAPPGAAGATSAVRPPATLSSKLSLTPLLEQR